METKLNDVFNQSDKNGPIKGMYFEKVKYVFQRLVIHATQISTSTPQVSIGLQIQSRTT